MRGISCTLRRARGRTPRRRHQRTIQVDAHRLRQQDRLSFRQHARLQLQFIGAWSRPLKRDHLVVQRRRQPLIRRRQFQYLIHWRQSMRQHWIPNAAVRRNFDPRRINIQQPVSVLVLASIQNPVEILILEQTQQTTLLQRVPTAPRITTHDLDGRLIRDAVAIDINDDVRSPKWGNVVDPLQSNLSAMPILIRHANVDHAGHKPWLVFIGQKSDPAPRIRVFLCREDGSIAST